MLGRSQKHQTLRNEIRDDMAPDSIVLLKENMNREGHNVSVALLRDGNTYVIYRTIIDHQKRRQRTVEIGEFSEYKDALEMYQNAIETSRYARIDDEYQVAKYNEDGLVLDDWDTEDDLEYDYCSQDDMILYPSPDL